MGEMMDPHANTVVCIEDSRMLKQFQYDILYNAKGLRATLDELNNINYFRSHRSADTGNYGVLLDELMKATFDLLREIAPDGLMHRIFALYYDIHNLKLAVKERFFRRRLDGLALEYGSYSMPTIRSAAVVESDDILKNETLTKGFFEALRAEDIYDVDFILDKTYWETLRKFAEDLKSPEIAGFVVERIDLFNLSALFQSLVSGTSAWYFAKAFSGHGSLPLPEWRGYAGDGGLDKLKGFRLWQRYQPVWEAAGSMERLFSEFDVLVDNYLIEKTKACKLMAFGIEPVCAYFYNKFMEIKNIRILLMGKEHGYDTGEIRKRMRIPYAL